MPEQPTAGFLAVRRLSKNFRLRRVLLEGKELAARPSAAERRRRSRVIQIVFQDPYTSLDPHQSVRRALEEVQRVHFSRTRAERDARSKHLIEAVGLGEIEARALPRARS